MPDLSISLVQEPAPAEREAVIAGLRAYNRRHAPAPGWQSLLLLVRGGDGEIVGGLIGESGWEWLYIQFVWVSDSMRFQGFGRSLMARAEAEAVARGCRGVHLDTHDFQAPAFYERLGYRTFGLLEDYPTGFRRHFLWKPL